MTGLRQWVARSHAARTFLPLVGYGVFAVLWIGRGVVLHPRSNVLGDTDRDKTILMWSFRWWPHAIAHGLDPFVAKVVWVPHGVDLAWVTSSPTLSLALAPVTETSGPVFAYNLAALAAPPLTAWTTYLLARRLTRQCLSRARWRLPFRLFALPDRAVGRPPQSVVCLPRPAGRPPCRALLRRKSRPLALRGDPRGRPRIAVRHLDRGLRDARRARGHLLRPRGSCFSTRAGGWRSWRGTRHSPTSPRR